MTEAASTNDGAANRKPTAVFGAEQQEKQQALQEQESNSFKKRIEELLALKQTKEIAG